jgi:K+-transporting ATPase KdpF subunit
LCAAATGCEATKMGDTILSGFIALLLMVYLTYALLVPERF